MPFNISRQPLVPAFLTLAALAAATVSGMDLHVDLMTSLVESGSRLAAGAAEGTVTATRVLEGATTAAGVAITGGATAITATSGGEVISEAAALGANIEHTLTLDLPETLLMQFQNTFPGWSKFITGLLILFAGMCTGRMTVRYNLYAVSTCLAIPLYGIAACGLSSDASYLNAFAASVLLALAIKNYAAAFCNGYGFNSIFRASAYLGLLILILPAALPLLLMLPLAVLLFRRTLREAVVGLAGLLLPTALFCYANWGAGGDFTAPLAVLRTAFLTGNPLELLYQLPVLPFVLLITLMMLTLFAVMLFLSDRYNTGTKARLLLIFNIGILLLTAIQLCGPAATASLFALLAVPLTVLLPIVFVRIHRAIGLSLYLLLLAAAFCGTILQ